MLQSIITRTEYLKNSNELHHAFYMQFVNDSIKCSVISLCKQGKRKWWDIPLHEWDALDYTVRRNQNADNVRAIVDTYNYDKLAKGQFYWSLSDSVCTLKNAAIAIYGEKPNN